MKPGRPNPGDKGSPPPRDSAPESPAPVTPEVQTLPSPTTGGQGLTRKKPYLFVVDDDAVTRLMLSRFLEKNGCEVAMFDNGSTALEAFEQRLPDIVLLDAKMPVLDGFAACVLMKQKPGARHVPVLMITGLNDDESVDRAFESGATDFITKPIHWAILRNRVNYLLRGLEAERQLHLSARVFESISEGIAVTDPFAIIQTVNPAFTKITGFPADEVTGRRMSLLKSGRHEPEFYRRLWSTLQEQGSWQGEIWNRRKNGEIYPQWLTISAIQSPSGIVSNYVGVFSDLTTIKRSEENLLHLAGHDVLTDLPNRILFHERLKLAIEEARRAETLVGILLLDLDRFKVINDNMGHEVGDKLLLQAAERFQQNIPAAATLGRMGGDEFAVILPWIPDPQDAAVIAHVVLEELTRPFVVDGMELFIGGSIGIGIFPLDGEDASTLMKNTDAAMYHAKEQGRNNFQFYRNELNTSSMSRMLLENSLRNAVEREEFILYYQPKVDLKSGAMVGMEALLRWRHPNKGMVSPGEFIPLAEETGLIIPMGQWALRAACHQNKLWQEAGFPPLKVAVNLSGLQFKQPDFTDLVARTLRETGLDPLYLELELTESIAMGEAEETYTKLNELSRMGVSLAIDDFGTGFSSLSYLKKFPINTLKIDQSFVRNCTSIQEDAAIIRTVVTLAHSLGLNVVAEGVEEPDQLAFIRENHCDEVQGYIYSKPLDTALFTRLMRERTLPLPPGGPPQAH